MSKAPISISIPTHCRPEMLVESFAQVLDDERVREVAISDDCSPDDSFARLVAMWEGHPKVKLFRNKKNLDCYRNKRQAVECATSDWTILLDDDNVIGPDYLDRLWELPAWDTNVIYCPDLAHPHFNYRRFAGQVISRINVAHFMTMPHRKGETEFRTALNTCNYFFHRQTYLSRWSGDVDPVTADTMFHAFNWLRAGGFLIFVQGMQYIHRIHSGSHYKNNWRRTGNFAQQIENQLKQMR
jgi:glycosyltransferase involved in cell wall biosynthesis